MSAVAQILGQAPQQHPLRDAFLKWQCRVRQMAMREFDGRPDDSIMPALTLKGADEPMGHIITLINKLPAYSVTPEMQHMVKRTNDPAQRRDKAIQFFSSTHYQKAREFSDTLTATFPPKSKGAQAIRQADRVTLYFSAYNQEFTLDCKVWKLTEKNPLYQSTYWHNALFNPSLTADTTILGFEPDWDASSAVPSPLGL
jgi:hypothetical protein